MSETNASSDLLPLTAAAKRAGIGRNTFNRQCQQQITPPPTHNVPIRRWSGQQIELWLKGRIRQNDDGFWYEWDADAEGWRLLPNQYINTLPNRAA